MFGRVERTEIERDIGRTASFARLREGNAKVPFGFGAIFLNLRLLNRR
jgi:hypothetical protein